MPEFRDKIKSEAERLKEDTLYSAKGHFNAAKVWRSCHYILCGSSAILGAAVPYIEPGNWINLVGLAICVGSSLATVLNTDQHSSKHLKAGNGYNILHSRVRCFLEVDTDKKSGLSDRDLRKMLENMYTDKSQLDKNSPQIPAWAYKMAKRGIERGEASYTQKTH